MRQPPEVPVIEPAGPVARLLPILMLVAVGGMIVLYLSSPAGSGASATRNPMYLIFPVMMVVSALGTLAHAGRGRTAELDAGRRTYLRYLDELADQTAETAALQHLCLHQRHPDPAMLWTIPGSGRMWERRPDDPDFGRVRVGLAPGPPATPLVAAAPDPATESDPVTAGALEALVTARSSVPDLPVTVELTGRIGFGPDPSAAHGLVRAIVCQLAVWHAPADLGVAVIGDVEQQWDWLKWLPHHVRHPGTRGPARTVVVRAGAGAVPAGPDVVVLDLAGDGDTVIDPAGLTHPDALSTAQATMCARRLARWRAGSGGAQCRGWAQLMGVRTVADLDPAVLWRTRPDRDRLRVPIGLGAGPEDRDGPVYLDLKEAAEHGMGPHGLCVGATGSGKSEFLRTLILGLVATHAPDDLNLALIDFKGGATFLGFDRLSHVSAVITNLAEEAYLVSRMHDALAGEMNRRQQILRAAGNLGNIADYRRARRADSGLPALPALLIVIDEFSELLSKHPDFAELFVAIGRLGRSLGMHLLLASQRLDEGRLRGLETHLSYRICLKTFSAAESRAILGVPDAYELPAAPGAAYLKTSDGRLLRLRTAFVSGPDIRVGTLRNARPRLFTCASDPAEDGPAPDGHDSPTVLDIALDRLVGHGTPAHRMWLPVPATSPTLDDLLARHDHTPLSAPIALVDNAFAQRRDVLTVDLAAAGGHAAVIGATRSGKSELLCTLLLALAARHTPAEVQFYCLDFGGGALAALQDLPHTGVVAGPGDGELARRTLAQLQALIRRRESGGREPAPDGYGEVFLVVDGWGAMRTADTEGQDGMEDAITAMAMYGLAYRVHVIVAASRWAELRPALKDQLGSRIELRLGEPAESEMDRKAARHLTDSPPGTGITRDGRLFRVARPRLHGADPATAAAAIRAESAGHAAVPVRLLPTSVLRSSVPAAGASATHVTIGIGESELRPLAVDFAASPHLIVLGDACCGKTSTLRTLCAQLTSSCTPQQVELHIVDVRRTLLGAVDSGHLAGYLLSAAMLAEHLGGLIERLRTRLPGAAVTHQQLRDRSWWSGPEVYLIVDDYELITGAGHDPLAALLELLPHARDIGLHLVLARRAGGAARAMFTAVPSTLRELGSAGLLMSAGPEEGTLLGSVRPVRLPSGRGTLIVRGRADERVQIGWTAPP
ncbi:type VII secretion protein EccCb [Mycobacterium sp. AMU20-3851]